MTILLALLGLLAPAAAPARADGPADYLRDVKPVLARRCYACHGALKQKAGLRLDTAASIRRGGDGGPAIEPGKADESLLIDKITESDPSLRMPPEGEPLGPDEVGRIRSWIDAGAGSPADETPQQDPRSHWAFRPPSRPEVPKVRNAAWVRNPIDAFLAAEHERRGLVPRPAADRATLLRRAALDLTGLAPSRDELHAFLADPAGDAYERAVDRLLASPEYGERWGRHWMDVWRYSDWAGFGAEVREGRPHIWRWRDWIIASLNADKGYDRMIREMLAGDEIAPDDPDTVRATGYLARNWYKFNRNVWLQNTVDHTAKAFLGLTLACARCHDHKYDPIAQQDYYRFRAFFEPHDVRTDRVPGQADVDKDGVPRVYDAHADAPTYLFARGEEKQPDKDHPLAPGLPRVLGDRLPIEPISLPRTASYPGLRPFIRAEALATAEAEVARARAALDKARRDGDSARERSAALAARLDSSPDDLDQARAAVARATSDAALAESDLTAGLLDVESARARIAADRAKYADPPDSKQAHILAIVAGHAERQAATAKAEAALARAERAVADARARPPGDAKATMAVASAEAKRNEARKAMDAARAAAGKLSAAYTPLTPVYPATSTGRRLALARWIADRRNPLTARVAVNHIWMRHFGRPLVPTVFDFGLNGKPPSHPELLDWLAVELMDSGWSMKHIHRLIVTSAAYRMESTGGPDGSNASIDPRNVYLWRMDPRRLEAEAVRDNLLRVAGTLDPTMGGPDLDQDAGLTLHRRSVYFRHAPEKLMTFLKLFDAANPNACYRRDESIVPQQALALANSPLALAQSRRLAGTLTREVGAEADTAFVAAAFEQVLGRPPSDPERLACEDYLVAQARRLADRAGLIPFADGPPGPVAPSAEPRQRARENLVHVLINHNDFVTIR
jgi:hypothetical protein